MKEIGQIYDSLATLTSEYFGLKQSVIKVEEQVYELGKSLSLLSTENADKYKAPLWLAWSDLQRILKIFNSICLD